MAGEEGVVLPTLLTLQALIGFIWLLLLRHRDVINKRFWELVGGGIFMLVLTAWLFGIYSYPGFTGSYGNCLVASYATVYTFPMWLHVSDVTPFPPPSFVSNLPEMTTQKGSIYPNTDITEFNYP